MFDSSAGLLYVAANGEPSVLLLCAAVAMLMVAGAADSVSGIFATILQTATPDHLRGRLQECSSSWSRVVPGWENAHRNAAAGIGEAVTMILAVWHASSPRHLLRLYRFPPL